MGFRGHLSTPKGQ
ncbi:rCG40865, partial [Rattus norvegicus]